nr:unnamed protein product [Digitaria exilis]
MDAAGTGNAPGNWTSDLRTVPPRVLTWAPPQRTLASPCTDAAGPAPMRLCTLPPSRALAPCSCTRPAGTLQARW